MSNNKLALKLDLSIVSADKITGKEFILNNAYRSILNRVFYFKSTFFGFKVDTKFYSRDISSQTDIWKIKQVNKVEGKNGNDFQIEELGEEKIDFIEVFERYLKDATFEEKSDLTLFDLEKNYKSYFQKYIPKHTEIIIYILDNYFNTSVFNCKEKLLKNNQMLFLESELTKEDIAFINKFNSCKSFMLQIEYIKTFIQKKHNPKKETDIKEIFKKCYNYKDINNIKKINTFFSKINIPGKYVIRHNELLLENWFNLNSTKYEKF